MRTLELTDEQKKTLKLFSYYCASHGAKDASLTVYLNEGGSVDWIDINWYASGTIVEGYDKINELINHILEDTDLLDFYDYDTSGSLEIEIDIKERKLTITGYHMVYDTDYSSDEWIILADNEQFNELFEKLGNSMGRLDFNGSGDSGEIESTIYSDNGNFDSPSFFEDWCYRKLESNYGGWEINEGSQGAFYIFPTERMVRLDFGQNTEEQDSDGIVGYVEF